MSQTDAVIAILSDLAPHRSDELVRRVYGEGCVLARLAARVHNAKRKVGPKWTIRSWKAPENPKLHFYQLVAA